MAEQLLLDAAFAVRVMPKPARIKAGCGFCLRFSPADLPRGLRFLVSHGIEVTEPYLREETAGTVSYRPFPEALA